MNRPLIAIVGPTGSGKTALALDVAQTFQGEIVNCDSMQLYKGFDVGTAKTPLHERRGVPHHLFDILPPSVQYSAGDYSRAARAVLNQIAARGRLPVIAGGTGFYLRALLEGLPSLPLRDEALREKLAARERRRPGSLHRLLRRLDASASGRIHPNDTQKLTRALEVRLLTGRSLPRPETAQPLTGFRILKLGLDPDRAELNARLDERVRGMFCHGLMEEVRALLAAGSTGEEKPFESLGYKQALKHIHHQASIEEAIASTQLETRQYAKRQCTWFRRDPEVLWLSGFGGDPRVRQQAFSALQTFYNTFF